MPDPEEIEIRGFTLDMDDPFDVVEAQLRRRHQGCSADECIVDREDEDCPMNAKDPDETMARMKVKLAVARKHRDCMHGNCIVGNTGECPHFADTVTDPKSGQEVNPKTGAPVATEKRRALACPECGDALDTLESTVGRGVTENGVWVSEAGEMQVNIEFIDNDGADSETIGAICASCSWAIERPDWFEYLKDYEANELKRIREELEKIKRGEA